MMMYEEKCATAGDVTVNMKQKKKLKYQRHSIFNPWTKTSNSPHIKLHMSFLLLIKISPKMAAGVGQTVCIVPKENGAVSLHCAVFMAAVVSSVCSDNNTCHLMEWSMETFQCYIVKNDRTKKQTLTLDVL